ncbi:aminoglycoside phosphotransferase family protein, partial [Candidatus Gracilibacteria bacterium]|nr:aminoglycoside phosphotransferase family protein [Candidatus Gracilibacteria bacterium]
MNTLPSGEVINEVVRSGIQAGVRLQSSNILSQRQSVGGWNYISLPGGITAQQIYIMEAGGQKIVLKVGVSEDLQLAANTEILINQHAPGLVPLTLQQGRGTTANGKPYFWLTQEFIPGITLEEYQESHTLSDEHLQNMTHQLGRIHSVIGNGEQFFGKLLAPAPKKFPDFISHIERFEHFIAGSDYFEQGLRERIIASIRTLKEKTEEIPKNPVLIHGDFHFRNVMIQDEQKSQIIDFGEASWNIREADFGIMFSNRGGLEQLQLYQKIITEYEKEFGTLNRDLIDLYYLCYGSYKQIKR